MTDHDRVDRLDEPAPDGFLYVAVPAEKWRLAAGGKCRRPHCDGEVVASLLRWSGRGRYGQWWRYCADHMYGKWIEGDRVMMRVLRPVERER